MEELKPYVWEEQDHRFGNTALLNHVGGLL